MEVVPRRSQRLRALKRGSIRFRGDAGIDCVVRDISEIGARLEVESQVGIPNNFRLFVQLEKVGRACRVVWRKANRIGVRFVDIASVGGLFHLAANSLADATAALASVCI